MARARLSGKAKAAVQAELERKVEEWNRDVPVGTEVIRTDDLGQRHRTRTRSIAWIVCGHASVMVDGISGGYLLERIKPVHPATARATGIDLDALAKKAGLTIDGALDGSSGEIRLRAGEVVVLVVLRPDGVFEPSGAAMRAAVAAALEVLAENSIAENRP